MTQPFVCVPDSSEIGYAGSPPRSALLRGRSIDSVDRPFHPSEWVDVNLEVPCTPRACVVLGGQRRQSDLTKPTGCRSPGAATSAPVPPPRRRKRRERRPLPPKPGSGNDAADDESEPEPLYSKLGPADRDHEDSEEEFATIEHILKKCSLEDVRAATRPKNYSATSLPNVADLLANRGPRPEDDARRLLGQAKSVSLPREATPFTPPQNSEGKFFARERESEEQRAEDFVILKDEVSPDLGDGFETSTPVKARLQPADDDLEDFKDASGASSPLPCVSAGRETSRRDEDTGYESRIESHPVSDVSRMLGGSNELSSGILRGDGVDSFEESEKKRVLAVASVQRTISEESLPREMLDELDEDDEQQPMRPEDEKSSKVIRSNGLDQPINANIIHEQDTPSPSPILNSQGSNVVENPESTREGKSSGVAAIGNPTSMTPSLMELEVALTDMLEKKDEREREAAEDKSSDKLPVPQIAALKNVEESEPSKIRLIDFPRADRTNPFNDFKSDDHEPPEKPSRLHRISLMEEPVIEESQLVPTPPRRRHRSKSNLNMSSEALHTYGDRLI
ncbi:PREDICTED: altered inheritance of mitochondria protein 21-like isoform X1 [Ceratosolen solmsi marchali]|uniref:Altered inheritance of mitochondria protein 21-like isoform X1 n=1 Tax=Ceratosolen solmsi marchali TaxID=326594 RepID=A0AAJ6YCG2_9HYME|nr:PREDICTED: altered inheritance of mitochondria protein 21-like isoform X1 [Ceratosolen solmsi marchali]